MLTEKDDSAVLGDESANVAQVLNDIPNFALSEQSSQTKILETLRKFSKVPGGNLKKS